MGLKIFSDPWTGDLDVMVEHRDIVSAGLTITPERDELIDFSNLVDALESVFGRIALSWLRC